MGWREWKIAVEYDGIQHWADPLPAGRGTSSASPFLEAAGWIVIRVSAAMLSRGRS